MPPVVVVAGDRTVSHNVPSDWIEGFNRSATNFVDCVLRGDQPDMDLEFSRSVLQATLAVYESSRLDLPVDPRSIGRRTGEPAP